MERVNDRFYYLMLIGNMLLHSILVQPYILSKNIFNGLGTSLLLALIVTIIRNYLSISVCNMYKDFTLIEISRELLGKYLGDFLSFIEIILNLGLGILSYRGIIEIVHEFILPTTPYWFLSLMLIPLPCVILFHSKNSHLQFSGLITVIAVISICIVSLTYYQNVRFDCIKVVMIRSMGFPSLTSVAGFTFFLSSASQLYAFNPAFNKINFKKTILLFILIGTPAALIDILIPVGVWGPWALQKIQFVWASTSDTVMIDLSPVERGLFLTLPIIFMLAALGILNYGFITLTLFKALVSNTKLKKFGIMVCLASFYFSPIILRKTDFFFSYATYSVLLWFWYNSFLAIPFFIMAKIKGGKGP